MKVFIFNVIKKALRCNLLMIVSVIILSVFFISCSSEKEQETPEITLPIGSEDYFSKSIDFDATGGEKVVTFTSNMNWNANISTTPNNVDWCTLSINNGNAGTVSLNIRVKPNETYDDRNAVIVITAGTIEKRIVVNQKQQDALTISTNKFEIPVSGGDVNIEVKANINYDVEIPVECQSWVHRVQGVRSRGLSSSIVSLKIDASEEYEKRQADITIKNGDKKEVITIYQAGEGILTLTKNQFDLDCLEQEITIEVSSNFDYDIKIPNINWISEISNQTRGVSTHTVRLLISENTEIEGRSATLIFYDKHSSLEEKVIINQNPANRVLVVSTNEYNLSDQEQDVSIEFSTNVDFDYEIPNVDWIKANTNKTRSISSHILSLHISENLNFEKRSAYVVVYDKNSSLKETVYITQDASSRKIDINKKEYNLSDEEQDVSIEFSTNVDFDYEIPNVDWIKANTAKTRAPMSSHTLSLHISENLNFEKRSASIVLYDKSSNLKDTVSITQEASSRKLVINKKEYNINDDEQDISVDITSNIDYSVTMPNVDWISRNNVRTRAESTTTLKLHISKNDTYDKRSASVVINDPRSSLSETVVINQSQNNALNVDKSSFSFDEKGGDFTIKVTSNVDYKIEIGAGWITEKAGNKTRGLSSKNHTFSVSTMTDNIPRETTIKFVSSKTGLSETVKVKQTKGIYFDKTSLTLLEGEKTKLTVTNNTSSSVSMSSSNTSVVTVDASGNVKAVAKGSAIITAKTADNKYKCECEVTVKNITDFVYASSIGGAIMSVNNLIQYGSSLNWTFTNASSAVVTLKSMQLIDGETGKEGNEMAVGVDVAGGASVAYSTTIGLLGIHMPVTCKFRYTYKGKEYSTEAVFDMK